MDYEILRGIWDDIRGDLPDGNVAEQIDGLTIAYYDSSSHIAVMVGVYCDRISVSFIDFKCGDRGRVKDKMVKSLCDSDCFDLLRVELRQLLMLKVWIDGTTE